MADETTQAFKDAIIPLHTALEKVLSQAAEIKKAINNLSVMAGEAPPFDDVDTNGLINTSNISSDQFFGKPFSSAVKTFLKMKKKAASAEEILDALKRGGFEFSADWKDQNAYLRNVASMLSKNRNDFVYINNDSFKGFGLWEFYPEKKKEREKTRESNQRESASEEKSKDSQTDLEESSENINEDQ